MLYNKTVMRFSVTFFLLHGYLLQRASFKNLASKARFKKITIEETTMKKNYFVPALALALVCTPLFAEQKVGRLTGISVTGETATLTIEEGALNPFSQDGFIATNGVFTQTVPLNVAVEFFAPKGPHEPRPNGALQQKREPKPNDRERRTLDPRENPNEDSKAQKQDKKERRPEPPLRAQDKDEQRLPPPKASVTQLHIDQLICLVYGEDDASVEKILVQPRHAMSRRTL